VTAEARAGGTYAYTYNAAGRMAEFRINGVLQASYKYDAMGRQAIRTLTSPTPVTIHSVFDSEGRRIAEYNEATGALIREYVWSGWEPVAVIEGGTIYYVRADHIGRPVFATNASGAKVWTATYTPFGGVHTSTGNLPENRFPGQWFQTESGLHQNWKRDYDPTTGRYLQADPLGLVDGASVYGYALQSPLMLTDPQGLRVDPDNPLYTGRGVPPDQCAPEDQYAQNKSPCDTLKKFAKGVGAAIWLICRIYWGIDDDPNTKPGERDRRKGTSPPDESGYTSEPYDPGPPKPPK
jgi:RHS repeat-associated protein